MLLDAPGPRLTLSSTSPCQCSCRRRRTFVHCSCPCTGSSTCSGPIMVLSIRTLTPLVRFARNGRSYNTGGYSHHDTLWSAAQQSFSTMSKNGSGLDIHYLPLHARRRDRNSCACLAGLILASAVVLTLALGFRLDLGLKHDTGSWLKNDAQMSVVSLDQLVNSSQFALDPSFSVSSISTTRYYNWTASLVNAAPVGIVKVYALSSEG